MDWFRRVSGGISLILLGALISSASLGDQKRTVYRNDEFGITLKVPQDALLCAQPTGEHDHGPSMLLGTDDLKGCGDLENRRSIWVFGSYNINDEAKSLGRFLRWLCSDEQGRGCDTAPSGLRVTGLPSMAGEASHAGWIDIIVGTKAGKPDPTFDPSVPSMNYTIQLHTEKQYLAEDLRVFRTVVRTIRIAPQE
ncbi:MAG TPA: hypothetical protein VIY69_13560 [Candidatus Acidoferrales bacterium]